MKGRSYFIFLLATCFLSHPTLYGQIAIISGHITDVQHQPVRGASVSLMNTLDGTTTDSLGQFSFKTDKKGVQTLEVTALGFETVHQQITPGTVGNLAIQLAKATNELERVTITAGSFGGSDGDRKTVLSSLDVVTTAGAQADPIAAMKMLPGVQQNETQTGLLVRGGDASEAAIVVDGLVLQTPFFTGGPGLQTRSRFSAFQFKGVTFSSGGYSARYGQAMSSVLEMNSLDLPDESTINLGIHMAGAYASADKLFHDDDMSISATLSYTNLSPFYGIANTNFDFYEVPKGGGGSLRYVWKTPRNGLLKVMSQYAGNRSGIQIPNPFEAGTTMNYRIRNDNSYTQASFEQYFNTKFKWYTAASFAYNKDDTRWGAFPVVTEEQRSQLRSELTWYANSRMTFLGGIELQNSGISKTFDTLVGDYQEQILAGYAELTWTPFYWLSVRPGLRLEHSGLLATTTLTPRLSASVKTGKYSQISLASGMFYQDPAQQYLWQNYRPGQQLAVHYIANFMYTPEDRMFRIEAYYKDYQSLVRSYASYDPNEYRIIEGKVDNSGYGFAQGIELFYRDKKTIKNLDFWLSYSYIDTRRLYQNFPEMATPTFIANHNLNVVGKYWIESIQSMVSATYNYASGKPYYNPQVTDFLSDHTPAYRKLSLQVSHLASIKKWFVVLYCGVDNALNHKNIFGYRYDASGQNRYPILPALYRSVFAGVNFSLTKFDKDEL